MSSKQLQSILKNIPSATAQGESKNEKEIHETKDGPLKVNLIEKKPETDKTDRIVAEIPRSLKKQIKNYIEKNEGMTEKTVILKALKMYGFNIDDSLLLDKRTTR